MPRSTIRTLHRFGAIAFALALALPAGMALAQQSAADPPAARAMQFSDQQLQSFAKAALQVRRIAQRAEASLQGTKTASARQAVVASAEKEQVRAVKASGLTLDQYNAISMAARQNPNMRMKIGQYVRQDLGRQK
jgi:hypothetical protein